MPLTPCFDHKLINGTKMKSSVRNYLKNQREDPSESKWEDSKFQKENGV